MSAHAEYAKRLQARRAVVERLQQRHILFGNIRLMVVVAAAGLALTFSWWWLAIGALVFVVLVAWHERVVRRQRLAARAQRHYEEGLARLEDRWAGRGQTGERFLDAAHPYAADLDIFGRGSLFELLSVARTRRGEETLASWLLAPADPRELAARQQAVEELRERLDLREQLALLGEDVRTGVQPDALIRWASEAAVFPERWLRATALALVALFVAGAAGAQLTGLVSPVAVVLACQAAFALWLRRRVLHVLHALPPAAHDLDLLAAVLARLEGESFRCPRLVALRAQLDCGVPPSVSIRRLDRLAEWADSRENWLLRLVGPPLLYATQLAFLLEAWRLRWGPSVPRWLDAVGEFEALSSLAGYAYEHPGDPFPELVHDAPRFEAEALGHPLLPEVRCVRNDLALGPERRVLVVSGSNMSGKSTLLRAVGVNAVLAFAGAPVRAARLRLSPLMTGASIRTVDSLQEGKSRFYAEILRLRDLMDLAAGREPLLFLLDELLHGTNSHDRRIGGEGIVKAFVERGAIGLLTTHDLALAHIADVLAPKAANVHFEDQLDNGRIRFDYRLRPGVVARSNALELMRSIGLDV